MTAVIFFDTAFVRNRGSNCICFQVALAQMEYQLPRLTRMWTHLERQSGGQVKGMGEKQIEVDKRILRTQVSKIYVSTVFTSLFCAFRFFKKWCVIHFVMNDGFLSSVFIRLFCIGPFG